MKVAIVGDFTGRPDEGLKVVSRRIARMAAANHDVREFDLRGLLRPWKAAALRGFRPELVHVVAGPAPKTAVIFWACTLAAPRAARVLSAVHPISISSFWALAGRARPATVLVQSRVAGARFAGLGANAEHLPVGVDVARFRPIPANERARQREKLGIARDERVLLHTGHLKRGRQLMTLAQAAQDGWSPVVVASSATEHDADLLQRLRGSGVRVITEYMPEIENMYGCADAYLFPTRDWTQAIETPLSVLEAMACNLPVVTTQFAGIPELFEPGEGLVYLDDEGDVRDALREATGQIPIGTRKKLLNARLISEPGSLDAVYHRALARGNG